MEMKGRSDSIEAIHKMLAGSVFRDVDLSKSVFDDVNLTNSVINNVNLTGVKIRDANLTGMTIEGVLVSDLFAAYKLKD